jgi:hypothetical protein
MAHLDFLKSIEIERGLTRDERTYMILFAAADVIYALRKLGRYFMMEELRPLWAADFSQLPKLVVPERTKGTFYFRPPPIPFVYDGRSSEDAILN